MKAVVDSSVLVSAFLVRGSLPEAVLGAASAGRFELLPSPRILTEIARSLGRPRPTPSSAATVTGEDLR